MPKSKCPACRRSFDVESEQSKKSFPFCSPRCRDVDLNRWLSEEYSVPVETERVIRESLEESEG